MTTAKPVWSNDLEVTPNCSALTIALNRTPPAPTPEPPPDPVPLWVWVVALVLSFSPPALAVASVIWR